MTETVSSHIYTSNFCGCCLGETSLLPSIVRGVEAWRFTVLRAASTQSDLVLNCDNGVQVSWEDAGFVVWFHRIQAEVSSKAARFTRAIVNAFFAASYTSISCRLEVLAFCATKHPSESFCAVLHAAKCRDAFDQPEHCDTANRVSREHSQNSEVLRPKR